MKLAWIFCVLLVVAFLISAKTHGRQHRLERELEGHWSVSFSTRNHPWVESFWFRQRVIYWVIVAVTATVLITKKWGKIYFRIPVSFAGSMIIAFILTGLMSTLRLAIKLTESASIPGGEWLHNAIWGSAVYWLLTVVSAVATLVVARKMQWNPS